MSLSIMSAMIAAAIALWWLLTRQLQAKPWLETGVGFAEQSPFPPQVVALGVFLAVVTSLFSLFTAAYHMRMNVPDWTHLPLPKLLWLNTGMLVLGSIALQWAWMAADRLIAARDSRHARHLTQVRPLIHVRLGLWAGGMFAIAFIAGQLLAWRQLDSNGFFFACTPASAFFYVMTGLHAAHLLGGLLVLAKTTAKLSAGDFLNRDSPIAGALLGVKLCAMYWHYLLLIWLALFALFALA